MAKQIQGITENAFNTETCPSLEDKGSLLGNGKELDLWGYVGGIQGGDLSELLSVATGKVTWAPGGKEAPYNLWKGQLVVLPKRERGQIPWMSLEGQIKAAESDSSSPDSVTHSQWVLGHDRAFVHLQFFAIKIEIRTPD